MQRGNYRNIGNSFISGGVFAQQLPRQTRSSPAIVTPAVVQEPVPAPPSSSTNNIEIKTDEVIPDEKLPPSAFNINTDDEDDMGDDGESMFGSKSVCESDLMGLRKINFKKKVSGKEKRVKQNKKLYRMLTPRNAIAALNELTVGQTVGETVVVPIPGSKFEAEVVLHNVKYKGQGISKMAAKNSACEKALRDLIINKFRQAKQQAGQAPQIADTESLKSMDVNMEEAEETNDVPMLQLASFALHKLFAEWESEGFEVPFPKNAETPQPSTSTDAPKAPSTPKPPKIKNELPPNNITMHPVMLLSIMRPCTAYNDLGSQGITPNIMHTVGATIDGQSFIGQGRSKKEARKRVATQILQKLFNWEGSCC